jgi:hypothetical protein
VSDPQPQPQPITVMCPECRELIEVKDPEGLIRALHLQNECAVSGLLHSQP